MKRFISALLSVLIAAGSTVPSVYAADETAASPPTADEFLYEPDLPQVIHISGDKVKEMLEEYDEEHPEEIADNEDENDISDNDRISAYVEESKVKAFEAEDEMPDIFGGEMTEAPIRAYADTNTYTEYVYISSVEDLLAIDGHDGGYYELARDIDLKGMEWPGITLTNAVFDGKGHYIYNLTQTGEYCPGLFNIDLSDTEANVYAANINLSDININVANSPSGTVYVNVLGGAGVTPENCYVSGKIKLGANASELLAAVITKGINCDARVDITSTGDQIGRNFLHIIGLYACSHSGFEGDIKVSGNQHYMNVYGLHSCTDGSVFYGDIKFTGTVKGEDNDTTSCNYYQQAMYSCNDCASKGDIEVETTVPNRGFITSYGLNNCTDCEHEGNIYSNIKNSSSLVDVGSSGLGAVFNCTNCTFKGDMDAFGNEDGYIFAIQKGSGNTYTGDINVNNTNSYPSGSCYTVTGILRGSENTVNADINCKGRVLIKDINTAEKSTFNGNAYTDYDFVGIEYANDCVVNGNLFSYNGTQCSGMRSSCKNCTLNGFISAQKGDIYGIAGGSNNIINGDVMTQNGQGYGLYNAADSYISGSISEKQGYEPLYVTAASPYMGYFICQHCGNAVVSADKMGGTEHCTNGNIKNYYKTVYDMHYSRGTGSLTDDGEPLEFPPDQEKFPYTIKLVSTESGEVIPDAVISIDGTEYKTNENGIISVTEGETNVMLTVKIDGNIMLVNRNFYPVKNHENVVEVCEIAVDVDLGESDEDPGNPPQASFNGKKFSMFDLPASVSLPKVGDMQMTYDKNRKAYRILFGDIKGLKNTGKDFNRMYIGIQNLVTNARNGIFNDKEFLKQVNKPNNGALGFKGSGNIIGYIELQKKGDDTVANGAILARYTARLESTVPFAAAPVFFVTYGVTGTVEGGFTLTMSTTNMVNKSFEPKGVVALTVTPNVGLGIGMKKFASAEAGFDAIIRGQLNLPFHTMKDDFEAWLTGEFYILGSIMGFEGRTAWTLGRWKLYPSGGAVKAMSDEVTAFNTDEMTLADRSYLNNTTQDTREGTLKSNIYPYSTVKIGNANGRRMVVWLDDDPTRDDINRTAVYYSIKNNDGTWTEPKQVYDDGTADYQFDLFVDGSKTYIVWQNATEKVSGSSPDEIAPKIDLYFAEIGVYSNKNEWEEPVVITSGNTDYEYDPRIVKDSRWGQYIIWKQNDKNTPMVGFTDAKESVYRLHNNDGTLEPAEKVLSDMPFIYNIDVNTKGDVVCIADTDNDITTPGSTLYYKGMPYTDSDKTEHRTDINYSSDGDMSGLTHGTNNFFFMEDNTLKSVNTVGNVLDIYSFDAAISNPVIKMGSGDSVSCILYEAADGFDSSVYCAKYNANYGGWSAPLPAGSFDEKIRSLDVAETSNGIEIAAIMADIKVKNDYDAENLPENTIKANDISETVRLAYTTVKPTEDIIAYYLDSTDDIRPGCSASFEVGVQNDTLKTISKIHLKLTDGKGNSLYDGDCSTNMSSGSFDTLAVSALIPEGFTKGTITAEISVADLEESDTENNTVSETYGGTDLELKVRANSIHRTGCVDVNIQNNGSVAANNAVVSIKNAEGDVIAEQTVAEIASSAKEKVSIPVPEAYSRPKENTILYAEVVSADDLNVYNNADYVEVEKYTEENVETEEILYGDTDCDHIITASDSAFALQKTLVGTFVLPIEKKAPDDWMKYADVDCDKSITASDSAFILQKALVSTFALPAEKKYK